MVRIKCLKGLAQAKCLPNLLFFLPSFPFFLLCPLSLLFLSFLFIPLKPSLSGSLLFWFLLSAMET